MSQKVAFSLSNHPNISSFVDYIAYGLILLADIIPNRRLHELSNVQTSTPKQVDQRSYSFDQLCVWSQQ
jgi:hypothetical protein